MKKTSTIVLCILIISTFVSARTIEESLYEGKSLEVPGNNLTLLVVGNNEKSVVMCINNKIHLISKGDRKELDNLKVEPIRIYEDYTRLKITYSCESCTCDESCSNILCFSKQSPKQQEESPNELIDNPKTEDQEIPKQEESKIINFSITLFLIVLILLIILVKKRGK